MPLKVTKIPSDGMTILLNRDSYVSVSKTPEASDGSEFESGCLPCAEKTSSKLFYIIGSIIAAIFLIAAATQKLLESFSSIHPLNIDVYTKVKFLSETYVPLILLFFLVIPIALSLAPSPVSKTNTNDRIAPRPITFDIAKSKIELYPGYFNLHFSLSVLSKVLTEQQAVAMCSNSNICMSLEGQRARCPGSFTGIVLDESSTRVFNLPWFSIGTLVLCGTPSFECPAIAGCETKYLKTKNLNGIREKTVCSAQECPKILNNIIS